MVSEILEDSGKLLIGVLILIVLEDGLWVGGCNGSH